MCTLFKRNLSSGWGYSSVAEGLPSMLEAPSLEGRTEGDMGERGERENTEKIRREERGGGTGDGKKGGGERGGGRERRDGGREGGKKEREI